MSRLSIAAAAVAIALSPLTSLAADKIVVLNVDNASCELCGPIVKMSLSRVSGVKAVQIKEASVDSGAVATVTFDDATANIAKLIAATTNAGYPSHQQN
jgi:mercuric ion binding protein